MAHFVVSWAQRRVAPTAKPNCRGVACNAQPYHHHHKPGEERKYNGND